MQNQFTMACFGLFLTFLSAPAANAAEEFGLASATSLIQQHCLKCHGGDETNAGVDLSLFNSELDVWQARTNFAKVATVLREQQMPPEDEPPISDQDRQRLLSWLTHTLNNIDIERIPRDPGFVPPRRMNRHEYKYTVQDLFGLNTNSAETLPKDQVFGDGFDNEAIALTIEELWFEKVLAAAEATTAAVWKDKAALAKLLVARPAPPSERAVYVGTSEQSQTCNLNNDFTVLAEFKGTTKATIFLKSAPGTAFAGNAKQLRFTGFSLVYKAGRKSQLRVSGVELADNESHTVGLRVKGGRATLFADGELLESAEGFAVPDESKQLIKVGWSEGLSRRRFEEFKEGYGKFDYYSKPLSDEDIVRLTWSADEFSAPTFQYRPGMETQEGVTAEVAARTVIRAFLRRAFRGSPSDAEMRRYTQLYQRGVDNGLSYEMAMQLPVKAALVSPSFLLRSENIHESNEPYPLSGHELASRLSYFLWSSMPDKALLRAADDGSLLTEQGLLEQLNRILADPKTERFFERFALQWLRVEGLGDTYRPDPDRFPEVDDELLDSMKRQSVLTITDVFRYDRSLLELIDHDEVFVNGALARHYGMPTVSDDAAWMKVPVANSGRGGLLVQASVLTVSSSPRRTSPVFRGKWVLDVLLGEPPPPPPPNVPALPASAEAQGTSLREVLEAHRKQVACAGCHKRIDPLGLAMEQYDAVGRLRTEKRDTHASLDGNRFDGVAELKQFLLHKKRKAIVRQITQKLLAYATGRELILADERTIQPLLAKLEAENYSAGTLLRQIVFSEPFRYRMKRQTQSKKQDQP